mmetsp:Transcript_3167/g.7342  ORF Transcript_3167/g.7342 Transcript_3167/m.7342 type:complete len:201 (-) Transcript_3167:831-1433(-)
MKSLKSSRSFSSILSRSLTSSSASSSDIYSSSCPELVLVRMRWLRTETRCPSVERKLKHAAHTRTSLSLSTCSSLNRPLEQLSHTMKPQLRQWWRRNRREKLAVQLLHWDTCASGFHSGACSPTTTSLDPAFSATLTIAAWIFSSQSSFSPSFRAQMMKDLAGDCTRNEKPLSTLKLPTWHFESTIWRFRMYRPMGVACP